MAWIVAGVVVVLLVLGVLAYAALTAPACRCNKPGCGGGCGLQPRD